jgi:site-specific recombinase XerD
MNLYSKESPDSRGGPLYPYLDSYVAEMRVEGYAPQTARIYIRLVTDFGAWLAKRRVEVRKITAKFVEQYLEMRARHRRLGQGDLSALKRMVNLLVRQKVIAEPAAVQTTTPTQQILNNFNLHLRDERALAPATRLYYVEFAGKFVTWCFGAGPIDLSRLCAGDVTEFVQRSVKDTRVRMMTTALKSFLRFERYSGEIHLDLAACVPAVANWRLSSIPRALPPAQVELVLASVNRRTAVGQREYAILFFVARTPGFTRWRGRHAHSRRAKLASRLDNSARKGQLRFSAADPGGSRRSHRGVLTQWSTLLQQPTGLSAFEGSRRRPQRSTGDLLNRETRAGNGWH